ncbi:hypothetical protein Hanom_Chr13g01212421 [Helianthus anomalus]
MFLGPFLVIYYVILVLYLNGLIKIQECACVDGKHKEGSRHGDAQALAVS